MFDPIRQPLRTDRHFPTLWARRMLSLRTVPFAYVDLEGWNHMFKPTRLALSALLVALVPLVAAAQTAKPSVVEALKLKPIQANVEYDVPEGPAAENVR